MQPVSSNVRFTHIDHHVLLLFLLLLSFQNPILDSTISLGRKNLFQNAGNPLSPIFAICPAIAKETGKVCEVREKASKNLKKAPKVNTTKT